MKTDELRELDAWIFENVLGWTPCREAAFPHRRSFKSGESECLHYDMPEFTTDPAAAMQVLDKCILKAGTVIIGPGENGGFELVSRINGGSATTIPAAICLFAKQLFSK